MSKSEFELDPDVIPSYWRPPPPFVFTESPEDALPPGTLSTTSNLCPSCREFFTRPRPKKADAHVSTDLYEADHNQPDLTVAAQHEPGWTTREEQNRPIYFSTQNVKEVCLNARNQTCHLCSIVHARLSELPHLGPKFMLWEQQHLSDSSTEECFVSLTFGPGITGLESIRTEVTSTNNDFPTVVELPVVSFVKDHQNPAGLMPLGTTTSSDLSLLTCRTWIDLCLKSHTKCRAVLSQQNVLPARLLDVSQFESSGKVRLHEIPSTTESYTYLTLSHCWGKSNRLRLCQANLEEFKLGIAVNRLPATFTQAIEFTFKLKVQFLWIDCLCIVQDSPNDEDWAREASKMTSIYGNALCCIAASASSDSEGGCFRERSGLHLQPLRFERRPFALFGQEESTGNVDPMFVVKYNHRETTDLLQGPLDTRGWVFQEQVLAPRTLHFSKDQIYWECRQQMASETWVVGIPGDVSMAKVNSHTKALFDLIAQTSEEFRLDLSETDLLYYRWHLIVELYTNRLLTRPEDKIPALSGLADVMKGKSQDKYLAGLWEHSLLQDLAWHVAPESRMKTPSTEYRAPSWSWASVDGPVGWDQQGKPDLKLQCEILSVEVTPVDQFAPTGRVKSGSLVVSGLTRSSTWTSGKFHRMSSAASVGWLQAQIFLDFDLEPSNNLQEVILLQLFAAAKRDLFTWNDTRYSLRGLVLEPVDPDNDVYRRIGSFWTLKQRCPEFAEDSWHHKFIDGWTRQRLTIV